MFDGCSSLLLPDLTKWNLNKVNNINTIFSKCLSIESIEEISNDNLQIDKNNKDNNSSSFNISSSLNIKSTSSSFSNINNNSSSNNIEREKSTSIENYDNDNFDISQQNLNQSDYYDNFYN